MTSDNNYKINSEFVYVCVRALLLFICVCVCLTHMHFCVYTSYNTHIIKSFCLQTLQKVINKCRYRKNNVLNVYLCK